MNEDATLVERAVGGDSEAFAELYERYFDRVYDFLARMVRDQQQAADLAQDTFVRAMHSLSSLTKGASFKSWIFTIARNTALNQIERSGRTQPLEQGSDEDDGSFALDIVDTDRMGSPEQALEVEGYAALVWDAARAMDPKQYAVLDLTVRQGLDSAEIADVLGVTKNNAYVMVNRMKKTLEEAIGALMLFREGRRQCAELNQVLSVLGVPEMSADTRKAIDRHASRCEVCNEQKAKLASSYAIFGAFTAATPALGIKVRILEDLQANYPYTPGAENLTNSQNTGNGQRPPAPRRIPTRPRPEPPRPQTPAPVEFPPEEFVPDKGDSKSRRMVIATAAAGLLLILGGIVGVRAFDTREAAPVSQVVAPELPPVVQAVAPPATPEPEPVAAAAPEPEAEAAPEPEPDPEPIEEAPQPAAVGVVPPTPPTPVPVLPGPNQPPLGPGGSGDGDNNPPAPPLTTGGEGAPSPPQPTGGNLVLPPAVATTVPPPACTRSQPVAAPASLDFGTSQTSLSFEVRATETCGRATFQTQPRSGWVNVVNSTGPLSPAGSATITVRIDRAQLAAGQNLSVLRVTTEGGVVDLQIRAVGASAPPPPPPPRTATPQPTSTRQIGQFVAQPTSTPCRSSSITCR